MQRDQPTDRLNQNAAYFHVGYWTAAYVCWLVLTTSYHPTWALRVICTGLLVGGSAFYACFLTPRGVGNGQWMRSGMALIGCGVIVALVIYVIYDLLLGPDPRRFTLANNMVMDTLFVLVNTLIAALVATLLSRVTGRPCWWLFPDPESRSN